MGRKEKLIKKLMSAPKDFTFEEAATLLGYFTYVQGNKGKTSGSRVVFSSPNYTTKIIMHKPHPSNIIKGYVMRQVYNYLEVNGYFDKKED